MSYSMQLLLGGVRSVPSTRIFSSDSVPARVTKAVAPQRRPLALSAMSSPVRLWSKARNRTAPWLQAGPMAAGRSHGCRPVPVKRPVSSHLSSARWEDSMVAGPNSSLYYITLDSAVLSHHSPKSRRPRGKGVQVQQRR